MASPNPLFHTTELIELCLSHLAFQELRTAAQVCTLWRSLAYDASLRLKRTLFLEAPRPSATEYLVEDFNSHTPVSNQLFPASIPCVIGGNLIAEWHGIKLTAIAKVNPLLQHSITYSWNDAGARSIRFRPAKWKIRKLVRLHAGDQGASTLRRMSVTQPPCKTLTISNTTDCCPQPLCRYPDLPPPVKLHDDNGLTIGTLVDALIYHLSGEAGQDSLFCEHERRWVAGVAEESPYGMGMRIFEALHSRQVLTVSGFVNEADDDVARARKRGNILPLRQP